MTPRELVQGLLEYLDVWQLDDAHRDVERFSCRGCGILLSKTHEHKTHCKLKALIDEASAYLEGAP